MKRMSTAAVMGFFVLVSVVHWQTMAVSAEGSVQACMNPHSGEIKILVRGRSCRPGHVSLTLATGGGTGDGRGPRVVDSSNNDVGAYIGPGATMRQVGPHWLLMAVYQDGFRGTGTTLYYPLPDCAGPAYQQSTDGTSAPLERWADNRNDGLLHYVGDPIELLTIESARGVQSDGTLFTCYNFSQAGFFGPDASVDPATFGLTPPFRIVDP